MKEIERKFLVTGDGYKDAAVSCLHIVQGYICRESGRTVRVRLEGERLRMKAHGDEKRGRLTGDWDPVASMDSAWLTIKGPSSEDGMNRSEWEYEIPASDARAMLSLCTGKLIEKDRYMVPVGHIGSAARSGIPVFDDGLCWEVDVFHGEHEGLIIAELELPSENEKFSLPSWVGEEVTGDRRYYNSVLSAE